MKIKRLLTAFLSILLVFTILVNTVSCTAKIEATNLMDGVKRAEVTALDSIKEDNATVMDFALRLFLATDNGENTLISPISLLTALSMTLNGANGETKEQMQSVLGMTKEELNLYLYTYLSSLSTDKENSLSLANSVWFKDDPNFTVDESFLQALADYYAADAYKSPFDGVTLTDINNWVKNKTDKAIEKIVDDIPNEAVMYLVNALAFTAEWENAYEKGQVQKAEFTNSDGTKSKIDLMCAAEGKYLDAGNATGFIKYYKDAKYSFVALLPNEGVSLADYLSTLDGDELSAALANAKNTKVMAGIPKFEAEYSAKMSAVLKEMGMPIAFDPENADFSALGAHAVGNIYISEVFHKTYITVGEKGTKAGGATAVEMAAKLSLSPEEVKTVYLTRPFVYMLVDCENNLPLFIGTVNEL